MQEYCVSPLEKSFNWSEDFNPYDRTLTLEDKEEESTENGMNMRVGKKRIRLGMTRQETLSYRSWFSMSVVENELFPDGLIPKQIYEICVPESAYKKYLIENLPRGYDRAVALCDRFFVDLRHMNTLLRKLPANLELVIVDISEIAYLGFIKDSNNLQSDLCEFYEILEAMTQLGAVCVVFVNFPLYNQIFKYLPRPSCIKVQAVASDANDCWEARIVDPPELEGRAQFKLFSDDIPFSKRF